MATTIIHKYNDHSSKTFKIAGFEAMLNTRFVVSGVLAAVNGATILGNPGSQAITSYIPYRGTTLTPYLISSSADDDGSPAGTGALTIKVPGIDTNYDMVYETVTTNGATEVALTGSYLYIYPPEVVTAGTDNGAKGTIDISNTGQTAYYQGMAAASTKGTIAIIYVPPRCHAGVKINFWLTTATTAGDGIKVTLRRWSSTRAFTYQEASGVVANEIATLSDMRTIESIVGPGLYYVDAAKVGTTNQAANFTVEWGWRKD